MIEQIYLNTDGYKTENGKDSRKTKGQFFTPDETASFMAEKASFSKDHLHILDPGAGNGILAAETIGHCIKNNLFQNFTVDFIENDPDIIPVLQKTCNLLSEYASIFGAQVNANIYDVNFITTFDKSGYVNLLRLPA